MIVTHLDDQIYKVSVKYQPVITRYFVVSHEEELDSYVNWLKETWGDRVQSEFLGYSTTLEYKEKKDA